MRKTLTEADTKIVLDNIVSPDNNLLKLKKIPKDITYAFEVTKCIQVRKENVYSIGDKLHNVC